MNHYKTTFETWNKLASQYQEKFMEIDLYNDSYALFCQQLEKPAARIFEIGCGPGNITKYLLSQRPDFKIYGIDVAPNMIELAKHNNPTADFKVMDCRKINTINEKFDGIICGFCMPYLSKEECQQLLLDCDALLTVGGALYFSAIEGDYKKSNYETSSDGQHTMFVYYHQVDYLLETLGENHFEIVALQRKEYPKKDKIEIHMIFIAKKK